MDITILGIESSCDDTSAAVIRNRTLLSNVIASQAVHVKYGGVIPELASRAHQQNIIPVVDTALKEAGVTADKIDAIAFTRGPGLLGSLLVGVSFAKGLSIARNIPMVEVNHLQGHILSHFIDLPDRDLLPQLHLRRGEQGTATCRTPTSRSCAFWSAAATRRSSRFARRSTCGSSERP